MLDQWTIILNLDDFEEDTHHDNNFKKSFDNLTLNSLQFRLSPFFYSYNREIP